MSDLHQRFKDLVEEIEYLPGRWRAPAIAAIIRDLLAEEDDGE